MTNKRLVINMFANLFAFLVSMGINFILSPYIINTVGTEAYGFVGLANNFVSYGQLVTLALNSMAGRFITIKVHQNDCEGANKYFTSVIIANIATSILLLIPAIIIIINLDKVVNVPVEIFPDVQLLFLLLFLNFLIGIVLTTFNVATYITNRLDLSSLRDIQSNILRIIILVISFLAFKPSVWYIGLATLICTLFVGIYNIYYKKKLIPDVKFGLKFFDVHIILELLYSGIWHVIIKLGQILSDGLDLLISNLFIGPIAMGVLSVSKTVPNAIFSLLVTVSNVFSPQITIYYAKDKKEKMVNEVIKSMKFTGFFANIPLVFLITFGLFFYKLWVPNQDTILIHIITIITIAGLIVQGIINPLFSVFTITNKVKLHSFVIVFVGILNAILVLILLQKTNMGIFAIAGVSSFTNIIRDLCYTPIYSAYCLEIPLYSFYVPILRYLFSTIILLILNTFVANNVTISSWIQLFLYGVFSLIIGVCVNYVIMLNSDERKQMSNQVKKKLRIKD